MTLYIRALYSEKILKVPIVSFNETIKELHSRICKVDGACPCLFSSYLIFAGKKLENHRTISDYGISKECTLHAITTDIFFGRIELAVKVPGEKIKFFKCHVCEGDIDKIIGKEFDKYFKKYPCSCNGKIMSKDEVLLYLSEGVPAFHHFAYITFLPNSGITPEMYAVIFGNEDNLFIQAVHPTFLVSDISCLLARRNNSQEKFRLSNNGKLLSDSKTLSELSIGEGCFLENPDRKGKRKELHEITKRNGVFLANLSLILNPKKGICRPTFWKNKATFVNSSNKVIECGSKYFVISTRDLMMGAYVGSIKDNLVEWEAISGLNIKEKFAEFQPISNKYVYIIGEQTNVRCKKCIMANKRAVSIPSLPDETDNKFKSISVQDRFIIAYKALEATDKIFVLDVLDEEAGWKSIKLDNVMTIKHVCYIFPFVRIFETDPLGTLKSNHQAASVNIEKGTVETGKEEIKEFIGKFKKIIMENFIRLIYQCPKQSCNSHNGTKCIRLNI